MVLDFGLRLSLTDLMNDELQTNKMKFTLSRIKLVLRHKLTRLRVIPLIASQC